MAVTDSEHIGVSTESPTQKNMINVDVRFGSLAVIPTNITPTTAFGGKADIQGGLESENYIV